MLREADAVWTDGIYGGCGSVSAPSGVLNRTKYVFGSAGTAGSTSPGELLAAAIAASVSATVARKIGELGGHSTAVTAHAVVTLNNVAELWKIHSVHLDITAAADDRESPLFEKAVDAARRECPIASELNLEVSANWKLIPRGAPTAA